MSSAFSTRFAWLVLLSCGWGLSVAAPARAFIYPEHRQIGLEAWNELTPEVRVYFDALWRRAQAGYRARVCELPVSGQYPPVASAERGPCIDWVAWPAIAGDHACSPDELIDEVLPSRWIHDVAAAADLIAVALARAKTKEARENEWTTSNLRLQAADSRYGERASGNNAHFTLPLEHDSLAAFMELSTRPDSPVNALGLYIAYHTAALQLSAALGPDVAHADPRRVRRVLALEAFALHFLQDIFASGHIAGTWGDSATRKGTHDYYCAHGYSTNTWSGRSLVMYGDAHMRRADLQRAGAIMAQSMGQLFTAWRVRQGAGMGAQDVGRERAASAVTALDACKLRLQPDPLARSDLETRMLRALLVETPKPGRGPHMAAWPRHRADFGAFLGIESGLSLGTAFDGFGGARARPFAEFGLGVQLGFGLEGVVANVNSGTMYLQLGLVRQSEQVDYCLDDCDTVDVGSSSLPRVPSRGGVSIGLRLPFWLIPGDLILLAPILALAAPEALVDVAIDAASGGVIPWQRTFSTPAGYFEFVAGRVVNATFHGLTSRTRTFVPYELPSEPDGYYLGSVGFRSVALMFPLLEYTPFRAFAQTLIAMLQFQIAYAIDIPFDIKPYEDTGRTSLSWRPAHMFWFKLSLTGRGYL